jgi:hypothetical protein
MADEGPQDSREAAILRTWLRLREHEAAYPGQPYAMVLHLRRSRPKAAVADLAQEFSGLVGTPVSPAMFRKVLHQARCKFLELLTELGHGRT